MYGGEPRYNHREPTQSVCVTVRNFIVNVWDLLPWSQRFFLIFLRRREPWESREAANTSREAERKAFSPRPWSQRFFLIFLRRREPWESREAANTSREAARKKSFLAEALVPEVFLDFSPAEKNQEKPLGPG